MTFNAGNVSLKFEYDNESWANIMNSGLGPTQVTGGTIQLPQGGTRESRAAVTGGTFTAAEEPSTGVFDEIQTMASTLFPDLVSEAISSGDIETASERIKDIEQFMTNLGKSRLTIQASEFSDNPDEAEATNQVIDSFRTVVDCNISFTGFVNEVQQVIANTLRSG